MALNLHTAFKEIANDQRAIQSIREASVHKSLYEETTNMFSIIPGIKGGQQVAALKGFEYITQKGVACGGNSLSPDMSAISQYWEPQLQEINIKFCYSDFMNQFTQWGLANGYQIKDLAEAEFMDFIQDMISDAMRLDMQRNALFADEDLVAGDMTDANKLPFYQTIKKGLVPTLEYFKTIPELADKFISLGNNTQPTSTQQYQLASDVAANIFEEITDVYDFDGNILLTNQKMYKNYEKYTTLGAIGAGLQSSKDALMNGSAPLSYGGESITPMKNFDRWRRNDFTVDNGSGDVVTMLPHLALFTKKEHLQIGVDDMSALSDLTFEYIGGSDEHFYIKGNYMMDFKMVNPYEFKCAL